MSELRNTIVSLAALVVAILQLLYEAAFGAGHGSQLRQHESRADTAAHSCEQAQNGEEQTFLSDEALVRLCRRLQEELRRNNRELSTSKADVKALRLERRKVAQERKQEAEQREAFEKQLRAKAEKTSQVEKEHGKTVAALQKQLEYYQNAKGAFQGRVHQLEREVGDLRSELASRGHGQSELWQERSELIDDKARLGRQIAELSKRAQHAEADLATSRATARALASNNEDLQQRLAKQTSTCQKLEQRADELGRELADTRSELGADVDELRNVLNATLEGKAALASQCSALEAQAAHMEAGSMQLRAWLEEVISANEALEARVEALEASAAAADHERAALEGWVRGSVQEQAAASTRLASFQALSKVLETDGVCKSALIGVLAIHLAQRERQLSQILRAPSPNRMHALQCIEAGDDAESGLAGMNLARSVPAKRFIQECDPEAEPVLGHEPRTPSRLTLDLPGMSSASTSGHSSPCNGPVDESSESTLSEVVQEAASSSARAGDAVSAAQPSSASAEAQRPSTAPSPSSSSAGSSSAKPLTAANISSIRRAASGTLGRGQGRLQQQLLLLSRARTALRPAADGSASGLWQQRLERQLRGRGGALGCPPPARAQSASLQGSPQILADLAGPSRIPSPSQAQQQAFTKGPQVLATA